MANITELQIYPDGTGEPIRNPNLPIALDGSHLSRLSGFASAGALPPHITIAGVNGKDVPIRWLTHSINTINWIEAATAQGIYIPSWTLIAPVHANASANETDPTPGIIQAQKLGNLLRGYISTFHPHYAGPLPRETTDSPESAHQQAQIGEMLWTVLPIEEQRVLWDMGAAHLHSGSYPNQAKLAGYLWAHYQVYHCMGTNLYHLPQSEIKFLTMMEQVRPLAEQATGQPLPTLADTGSVVTLDAHLRTAHYYPHQGEPPLVQIGTNGSLPSSKAINATPGLNGYAKQEINSALHIIRADIGSYQDQRQQQVLADLIGHTLC